MLEIPLDAVLLAVLERLCVPDLEGCVGTPSLDEAACQAPSIMRASYEFLPF